MNTDEIKRDQMEQLVREELERWDSESNMDSAGQGSASSVRASPNAGQGSRSRSGANQSVSQSHLVSIVLLCPCNV